LMSSLCAKYRIGGDTEKRGIAVIQHEQQMGLFG
jgi:hypothetical protein